MSKPIIRLIAGGDPDNPLHDDIERAANERGWSLERITGVSSELIRNGQLDEVLADNIFWRRELKENTSEENEQVWDWVNQMGKTTMNTRFTGGRVKPNDKLFQQELFLGDEILRDYAIPTFLANSAEEMVELVKTGVVRLPALLKPRYGSLGKGIKIINSIGDIADIVPEKEWHCYAIEPLLNVDYDWRVFVIGGKAIGAMRKLGYENDRLDFAARSAGVKKWKEKGRILDELYKVAERAAEVMKADYVGIDLMRELPSGAVRLVEANLAGGWNNGFSQITETDVAGTLVDYFVERNK